MDLLCTYTKRVEAISGKIALSSLDPDSYIGTVFLNASLSKKNYLQVTISYYGEL